MSTSRQPGGVHEVDPLLHQATADDLADLFRHLTHRLRRSAPQRANLAKHAKVIEAGECLKAPRWLTRTHRHDRSWPASPLPQLSQGLGERITRSPTPASPLLLVIGKPDRLVQLADRQQNLGSWVTQLAGCKAVDLTAEWIAFSPKTASANFINWGWLH